MTNIKRRKYKMSRNIKAALWGQQKDPANKKNYKPGQHGRSMFRMLSEFGKQMLAKQCFKWYYSIREKQFKRIVALAHRKKGNTPDVLVGLLEARLSSVLYTAGIVPTIFASKQLISHKHIMVNDKVVNKSSYTLTVGDVVKVRDSAKNLPAVIQAVESQERKAPGYLEVALDKREAKLLKFPTFAEIPYPTKMKPEMVIELYSR